MSEGAPVAWHALAACRGQRWVEWAFGTAEEQRGFIALYCRDCPVRAECEDDGRHDQGVRGGRTRMERKGDPRDGCGCWSCGRQRGPRLPGNDTGACGTTTGYMRHLRLREDTCGPCRAAEAAYRADRRTAV